MNYSCSGKITKDQNILVNLISAVCDWSDDYKVILKKKISFLIKDNIEQN